MLELVGNSSTVHSLLPKAGAISIVPLSTQQRAIVGGSACQRAARSLEKFVVEEECD
jgi:hypothetical protein